MHWMDQHSGPVLLNTISPRLGDTEMVLSVSIMFGLFVSSASRTVKCFFRAWVWCLLCVGRGLKGEAVKASLLATHKILVFGLASCYWCEKAVCLGKCVFSVRGSFTGGSFDRVCACANWDFNQVAFYLMTQQLQMVEHFLAFKCRFWDYYMFIFAFVVLSHFVLLYAVAQTNSSASCQQIIKEAYSTSCTTGREQADRETVRRTDGGGHNWNKERRGNRWFLGGEGCRGHKLEAANRRFSNIATKTCILL